MNKYKTNIYLLFLCRVFLFFILLCSNSFSYDSKISDNLIVLGKNNAPVKIKIFSSLTCPHCASFHKNVVSKIEKHYVNSGKVQIIFLDFPLDQAALNASKLLHCLEEGNQIEFLNIIYENQHQWTSGSNLNQINDNLKKIVENLGISSNEFKKCLNSEEIESKILNSRIDGQKKYSINSTPTIIINEKKFKGEVSFNNMKKKIEKLINRRESESY